MFSRPAVMALEERGVEKETFMALQEETKRKIYTGEDSLKNFSELIEEYHCGGKFHLGFILEQLIKLGLDFKDGTNKKAIKNTFFKRLLRFSIHHSFREVKFKARIRVPESYQLVGVADEGRAYIEEGVSCSHRNLVRFTVRFFVEFSCRHHTTSRVLVCVQEKANGQPIYLSGKWVISRNPVIHPGDGTYINVLLQCSQGSLMPQYSVFGQWASRPRTSSASLAD